MMCNPLSVPRVCLGVCWVESSSLESRLGRSHDQMPGPPQPLPLRGGAAALPSVPHWCLAGFPLSENEPTHSAGAVYGLVLWPWVNGDPPVLWELWFPTHLFSCHDRTSHHCRNCIGLSFLSLFLSSCHLWTSTGETRTPPLRQQLFPVVQRTIQQTERCWSLSAASPIESSWRSLVPQGQCHQQHQGQIPELTKPEMLGYFT